MVGLVRESLCNALQIYEVTLILVPKRILKEGGLMFLCREKSRLFISVFHPRSELVALVVRTSIDRMTFRNQSKLWGTRIFNHWNAWNPVTWWYFHHIWRPFTKFLPSKAIIWVKKLPGQERTTPTKRQGVLVRQDGGNHPSPGHCWKKWF